MEPPGCIRELAREEGLIQMRIRFGLIVASVLVALLPFAAVAQAASNEEVIAQQKAAAQQALALSNTLNDLARCKMASAGLAVPGNVTFSQPEPAALVNSCTPPAPSTASGTSTSSTPTTNASGMGCVTSLTTAQANLVNDWAIAVQKAISNKEPQPAMPPEVAALIGAC
jgi:hypothetical protein